MTGARVTVGALMLAALTACAGADRSSAPSSVSRATSTVASVSTAPTGNTAPATRLEVKYRSTCQAAYPQVFVIGDGTSMTMHGYRFIADITIYNRGNVPAVVIADIVWHLVGGQQVKSKARVIPHLLPGHQLQLGFTQPATSDQIELMSAHQVGDKLCSASVSTLKGKT